MSKRKAAWTLNPYRGIYYATSTKRFVVIGDSDDHRTLEAAIARRDEKEQKA